MVRIGIFGIGISLLLTQSVFGGEHDFSSAFLHPVIPIVELAEPEPPQVSQKPLPGQDLNNTWTGTNAFSGPATFTGTLTTGTLDGIAFIDGIKYPITDAGFSAAITAAGTNGTIDIPPNTVINLTTAHSFLNGQTIRCDGPLSGFTYNVPSGNTLLINAVSNVRVMGCSFTWQSGTSMALDIVNTASNILISKNTFNSFPATGTGTTLFVGDRSNTTSGLQVQDVQILDNQFKGFSGNGVNIQDFATRITVSRNTFVNAVASGNFIPINAQATDASTTISDLHIESNQIFNGTGSDCVQVQQLSGNVIQSVVIKGNTCTWLAAGNGFSSAGINGLTQANNVVNANGFTQNLSFGNAIFEMANVNNSSETGDVANLGTQLVNAQMTVFTVIAGNPVGTTNNDTFTGNVANVAYTGNNTLSCWYIGATQTAATIKGNNVTGNACNLTGSTGKTAGLFIQTSNAGATITNNQYEGNTFIGTNVTGDCGICIENDSGTLTNEYIGINQTFNFHLPYGQNFGGQTSGFATGTTQPASFAPNGISFSAVQAFPNNTVALTADWTCGTGGTVASCTSATIIGSGGGVPLTFTLPPTAQSYTLLCDGVVGQATAVTANQWNLLTATNGATNVTANYTMATAATAYAAGAITDQASTTTTFQIAPSWTLGAITTKMPFHIWAKIEGASASGTVLSLQLLAPTVGDLVTIYRGTACTIF